jgi:PiT family inorganic phosphate transporter
VRDALVAVAVVFAVVAGTNDGSSILSAGLRVPGLRPLTSLAVLMAAVLVGPIVLFGTGVATTLAHHLVPSSGASADRLVLVAAVSAMTVVFALTRFGLPTSLTLALIGGITGAGLGAGLPLSDSTLVTILVFGAAAPLLCVALGFLAARVALRAVGGSQVTRRARRLHGLAFSLQCLAYSANGGQKMLAIFAVAAGAATGSAVRDPFWLGVLMALLFGCGALLGLRRISESLGKDILAVHLRHALVAESCSFAVVMGAGLMGLPVTMSQSVTGALIGAGASESRTRVRWPAATRIAGAWAVTLPASIALAALGGGITRLI